MRMIKMLFPYMIRKHYRLRNIYKAFLSDALKFIAESNTYTRNDSKEKLRADIIMRYHSVEKGLTMPDRKFLFGQSLINVLIAELEAFKIMYGIHDSQVRQAVKILSEYVYVHEKNHISIESDLKAKILTLRKDYNVYEISKQKSSRSDIFFNPTGADFKDFAKSRVSTRNYSESDIPIETFESVIELALTAPSACNRQPNRVYVVSGKDKIDSALKLQSGNRGFGHLANKLLVVTVDLSGFVGGNERNLAWVDGGIFSMNLLYALHYYKIGACPLNWAVSPDTDKKMHQLLNIPSSFRIALLISCGYPSEQFSYPISLRYGVEDCLFQVR